MSTKPAQRIRSALTSLPWAITEDYLRLMLEIASRQNLDVQTVEAQRGEKLQNTYTTEIRNGVAVIPVRGPIARYMNLFSQISGGTSIDMLARDFNAALKNTDVRAILLNIDSPGGETNGVSEFANMVYTARGQKPITAYVGGLGASAAYWIASAADEIVVDDMALVGSIGVIAAVPIGDDFGEVTFVSSQSPRKHSDPETEEGKADIQGTIDSLAQVFVEAVARNRGVSADAVLSDFGQGGLFVGKEAVAAGLADRLGSFERTLAEMGQAQEGNPRVSSRTPNLHAGAAFMAADFNAPLELTAPPAPSSPARPHTATTPKEQQTMADELEQVPDALPPIQPPQIAAGDPAVQAQVNAVVAQMTAQFEAQRQIVLEQAQAQFQRQLAEMQAQQIIQTYAQHVTTPTMQRQHALPLEASAVASFLAGLNASQRVTAQGMFDRILDAGLVSFEEIGTGGGSDAERDVAAEWRQAVTAKVATGMTRSAAIEAIKRDNPTLFREYNESGATYTRKGGR